MSCWYYTDEQGFTILCFPNANGPLLQTDHHLALHKVEGSTALWAPPLSAASADKLITDNTYAAHCRGTVNGTWWWMTNLKSCMQMVWQSQMGLDPLLQSVCWMAAHFHVSEFPMVLPTLYAPLTSSGRAALIGVSLRCKVSPVLPKAPAYWPPPGHPDHKELVLQVMTDPDHKFDLLLLLDDLDSTVRSTSFLLE